MLPIRVITTRASVSRTTSGAFRRTRGAADVGLVVALTMCGWFASQWRIYEEERRALETLNSALLQKSVDEHARARAYADVLSDDGLLFPFATELSVYHASIDQAVADQFAVLSRLRTLRLDTCRIAPDVSLPRLDGLENLELPETPVTLGQLRSIGRYRRLKSLWIDASHLPANWLTAISGLSQLMDLEVDDGSLDRSSFRALSRLRNIRTLQIVRTDIDGGLGSSLEKLQQLHALVLSDVDVSDEDMKYVAQLRKLGVLYVDSSTLTDVGVAHLANSRIFRLSLGGCTKVTDRSVRQLGKLTTLGLLDLRHTRVTNACLPALARLPRLHSVLVDGTEINKSRPGFVGVVNGDGDVWYPSEARRNEVAGE